MNSNIIYIAIYARFDRFSTIPFTFLLLLILQLRRFLWFRPSKQRPPLSQYQASGEINSVSLELSYEHPKECFVSFFLPFSNVTRGDPRDDNIDPETETYVNLQATRTNVVLIDTWSSCKAGLIDFTLDFRGSFETVRVPSTSERRTRAAFVLRGHENKGIKEKCHRTSG